MQASNYCRQALVGAALATLVGGVAPDLAMLDGWLWAKVGRVTEAVDYLLVPRLIVGSLLVSMALLPPMAIADRRWQWSQVGQRWQVGQWWLLAVPVVLIAAALWGRLLPIEAGVALLVAAPAAWQRFLASATAPRTHDVVEAPQISAFLSTQTGGAAIIDRDGAITEANPAAERLFGRPLTGQSIGNIVPGLASTDMRDMLASAGRTIETDAKIAPTSKLPLEVTLMATKAGAGHLAQFNDITAKREREVELERLALHDPVTGLANRILLYTRLERALERARGQDLGLGLMTLEITGVDRINQALGRQVGDMLLKQVAVRLQWLIRPSDLLARIDGPVFSILLTEPFAPELIRDLAVRIVAQLEEPVPVDGSHLDVGVAMGVATFPEDGADRKTLLRAADAALGKARRDKRSLVVCDGSVLDSTAELSRLRIDLREAIADGQLQLLFQPLFQAVSRQPVAVEALLRWNHPTLGRLEAKEFMAVAEQAGELHHIGLWAVHHCLKQQQYWRQEGLDIKVAVNLASASLRIQEFPKLLKLALRQWRAAPDQLVIEISENAIMEEVERGMAALHAIRDVGCELALDDFGVGFSSLPHLHQLPLGQLKMHRQLIGQLQGNEGARAVMKAMIELAHGLGLRVVATGVETAPMAQWLAVQHCDLLQGFHLGQPITSEQVVSLFRQAEPQPLARAAE